MRNGFRQAFAEALAVARSSPAGDCRSYSKQNTPRCSSGTLCRKDRARSMDLAGRLPKRLRLRVPLRRGTAGATEDGVQARDGDASAVVPALCAGRLRQPQGISPDVCRSDNRSPFLSGRGLPELQQGTAGATAGGCRSYSGYGPPARRSEAAQRLRRRYSHAPTINPNRPSVFGSGITVSVMSLEL